VIDRSAFLSKTRNEDHIMRSLILAAAATLVLSGTAMAAQHHHHHHHAANVAAASTPVPDGAVPADVLSAHELVIRNLHDSGYNPAADNAPN
jgi:hypothetical protein